MGRLDDHVAIITGAAGGQGRAQAEAFVREGARVVIADVLGEAGRALAEDLGPAAVAVELDVTSEADWSRALERCREVFGDPSILVNNAGVIRYGNVLDASVEDFRAVFDVNVLGTLRGIQAVAPSMVARGRGSIVNVSSAQGLAPLPGISAYCTAKFGVTGLTRSAALELGPSGVRVNSVHPGSMNHTMAGQGGAAEDKRNAFLKRMPLGRGGELDETAMMVLFVASDEASYATGGAFVSDGGMIAGVLN